MEISLACSTTEQAAREHLKDCNRSARMNTRRDTLSGFGPYKKTSQRDIGRGRFDHPAGSHGVTQYYAGNEIIRMPAGSIVQLPRLEPSFEPFDPPQANLHRALMFALPISLVLWGLIGFAGWLLLSVFF
jgi:hypothetical protein